MQILDAIIKTKGGICTLIENEIQASPKYFFILPPPPFEISPYPEGAVRTPNYLRGGIYPPKALFAPFY